MSWSLVVQHLGEKTRIVASLQLVERRHELREGRLNGIALCVRGRAAVPVAVIERHLLARQKGTPFPPSIGMTLVLISVKVMQAGFSHGGSHGT
jgi:hypothetical protein